MLETSLETVCFIVVKARELDAAEGVVEGDPASNPSDDGQSQVLATHQGSLVEAELKSFIDNLNEDQQAELLALMLAGRGDQVAETWEQAVTDARERMQGPVSDYLLGTPMLADLLEEGLNQLDMTCEEVELGRM